MTLSNFCHLCNSDQVLHVCDCAVVKIINSVVQCRSCGGNCNGTNCPGTSFDKKVIQARIQNQVGVPESQRLDVYAAFTSSSKLLTGSKRYGIFNYPHQNLSDRIAAAKPTNNNVPTRGNSVKSSVTSNRPGSMVPGGAGVDVKHDSYARYLGKIKASNIISNKKGPFNTQEVGNGARLRPAINNKQYRFSIVHVNNCCPK